jgi:hypothetical protein
MRSSVSGLDGDMRVRTSRVRSQQARRAGIGRLYVRWRTDVDQRSVDNSPQVLKLSKARAELFLRKAANARAPQSSYFDNR